MFNADAVPLKPLQNLQDQDGGVLEIAVHRLSTGQRERFADHAREEFREAARRVEKYLFRNGGSGSGDINTVAIPSEDIFV